jgi:signal transduction histidine kinase
MSIRLRLAALFTLATIGLLGAGGLLFVQQLRSGLLTSLDLSLRNRADGVVNQLGSGNFQDNSPQTLPSSGGTYVQLLTTAGVVVQASDGLPPRPLLTPAQAATAAAGHVSADVPVALTVPGETGPETMRLLAMPSGQPGVVVAVVTNRDIVDEAVTRATEQLLILSGVVLVVIGPGAWLLTRAALKPVERMRRHVAELDAADAAEGLPVPRTRDEIARLAQTFNGLLARLHAAVGRERAFVADAGHELRTPLSVLKGELELARRPGRSHAELADTVEVAAEETERLVRLAEDLLVLASDAESPHLRTQRFDAAGMIRTAVNARASGAERRGIVLVLAAPERMDVTGDPDRIRQALDNLISNALRYSQRGATVSVDLHSAGGNAVLAVADTGPGFPPEFLPHAFERFARADGSRGRRDGHDEPGGNGLGLAIVEAVMTGHDGTATAANRDGGGAVVTLRWPLVPPGR